MDIPLHQLTNNQTKLWVLGGDVRRALASNLSQHYRSGCGVVAWRGQLIAYVAPNGEVRELAPPFKRIFRREVSNAPSPGHCACRDFFDPEVQGPWSERGVERHHPMCEFSRYSHEVFNALVPKPRIQGDEIQFVPGEKPSRADAHLLIEAKIAGVRGEKSGPRTFQPRKCIEKAEEP